jgi:inorganic pyrophosphatase
MWHAMLGATNRTLAYVALGSLAIILGIQVLIFAIWGNDGDPPNVVVAIAFVIFWGAVLTLLVVASLALRRRLASRRP